MANEMAQDIDRSSINRKVWIINTSKYEYTENFRGSPITVPPNGEKKTLMTILAAERFKGQPKAPAEYLPNGQLAPNSPKPKALQIVELTDEEREKIEGKSKEQVAKDVKKEEQAEKSVCSICGGKFKGEMGLKVHLKAMHPEYEPVSSEE
jgi:hypothetical protein